MAIKHLFGRGIGLTDGDISWVVTRGYGIATEVVPDGVDALQRLEVWSTFQCAGGSREAFLSVSECQTLVTIERTQHDDQGEIVLSKQSDAASYIETGKVIRFLYVNSAFTEWLVWTIDDTSRESQVLRISLRSVLQTLDSGAAVLSEASSTGQTLVDLEWKALTPASHVAKVLTFSPSYWTAGTITPTIPVDLTPSGWMPLRALRELVTAIKAQAVGCELHYRRNGTVGYYIDIVTSIGSGEDAIDVRTTKNLIGMSRRRDREKFAVEVVSLGTGSPRGTIRAAWWECTAKVGSVLTMQQPVTGGAMIGFDDQLNTTRYLVDDTGARIQITDCDATNQTVTVLSATNFTAGRWYRVVADSSGTELVGLRKAAGTAGAVRVVESSVLDGTTNLTLNPAMRAWAGSASSPPDSWTNSGGTLTRTSTAGLWVYGGQSCRTQGSVTLESPGVSIYVPTWATHVCVSMWVYHVAGTGTESISFRRDGSQYASSTAFNATFNQWQRITSTTSLTGLTGAVHSWSARFVGGASNNTYVDSVQVTLTNGEQDFVEGSNPAKLWALANQYLATYSSEPTSYGVSFADLNMWDPSGFPWDAVALGQTAHVSDTDLDVTTSGRIIELKRDWKNPLASQLTIATRPEEFVSLLTGIAA